MMIARHLLAAGVGAVLLGGCATLSGSRGDDRLAGQTLRVQTSNGQQSTLRFEDGGTVRATFGRNQVTGRWSLEDRQLCFFWTGAPRECWRYAAPFARGRTVTVTSDRGNVVRVTRL